MLGSGDSKDPDSSSMSKSLFCRGVPFTGVVMRENIEDAILFFEHRRGVCRDCGTGVEKAQKVCRKAIKDGRSVKNRFTLKNRVG